MKYQIRARKAWLDKVCESAACHCMLHGTTHWNNLPYWPKQLLWLTASKVYTQLDSSCIVLTRISHETEHLPPSVFSLFTQPCLYCICTVDSHAPAAYLECHCQYNVYTLYNRQLEHVHAPVVFHKRHLSSSPWLVLQLAANCMKILLYVHMWPMVIVLNYSIKYNYTVWHRHIYTYIYIRENPPFNSLV